MNFKDYLKESKHTKTVVFAFGRFNPISTGHELLANKVAEVAKKHSAKALVVPSSTQDSKKNPLAVQDKLKYMKKAFKNVEVSVAGRTFIEVAKSLSESGIKHLIMVAGSDRVDQYQKLLNTYNGKDFHFDSVSVVSAGERDPDAEGVTGISGTKLREAAAKNDFKTFRAGTPKGLSDADVKKLMELVRHGMKINENINLKFEELLSEGVHDKSIFKAVFLGGGPGSGKDFVLDKTLSGHGLTEINSDKALEYLMDKNNLDMTMPENETEARDVVRGRAKNMTELRQRLALFGRNGVIINGTGDDPEKITDIKKRLEELGYETSMVMVNTRDEVSQQRNIERGQRGGRTVPEKIRKGKWDAVQKARPQYAEMFGDKYTEIDNSEDLRQAPKDVVDAKENEMLQIFKKIQSFVKAPPKAEIAKTWIASELEKKDSLKVDKKTAEVAPHPDSGAADEARKMGLQYYGFGRYGKNGQVTHRSVNDKLTAVTKQPDQSVGNVPVSGSSMSAASIKPQGKTKERLQKIQKASPLRKLTKEDFDEEFESLLNETVTLSISADTPEEINDLFKKMFNKETETKNEETRNYQLSGTDALNVLSLGKKTTVSEIKTDNITFSNDDVEKILEERKEKYLTSANGKPRVFMLRRAAAKEAHQKNGTVVPHEKSGYLVKLKEETNDVEISERHILSEETSGGREASPRFTSSYRRNRQYTTEARATSSEEKSRTEENYQGTTLEESSHKKSSSEESSTKITLSKIRAKQKEKIKESIDKGTEAGVSMAGSGESPDRDMGERNNRRGKAIPVRQSRIAELTGDETTATIGDQKEDELKKKGISLLTFKKRNFV